MSKTFDELCSEYGIDRAKCGELRMACAGKGRRGRSEYQKFIGSCVKQRTGPVTERFKQCVVEWKGRK